MKTHISYALVAASLLLAGCATDKGAYSGNIKDDAPAVSEGSVAAGSGSAAASGQASFQPAAAVNDYRSDPSSLLSTRVVFFDYDKSEVRDDALPVLQAHAAFLAGNPQLRVLLAGHADERGSNEYNLALGQRRADAVRDIMLAQGVPARQIEAISFGEEYPRATGQNESAWQENRRAEIRYSDE